MINIMITYIKSSLGQRGFHENSVLLQMRFVQHSWPPWSRTIEHLPLQRNLLSTGS